MVVKKGCKQTEIGVIPEDWDVRLIREVSNPVRGGSPRPAGDPRYFDGSFIPWLTVSALTNIPSSQLKVLGTESFLTEEGSLRSRVLFPGTLIIANSGATLGIAKILGIKCCANDGIAALLNFSSTVSTAYLVHYINTRTQYLRDVVATGNGQPNLNTDLIGSFKVPLPTLAEQEAIASALSDADAWIESLEQLIDKKRQIKQGAMQELLTGKRRLPGFSGEWEAVSMRQVLAQNATYGIVTAGTFVQNGVKMLRSGDIAGGRINTDLPMVSREKAVEYARTALIKDDVAIALVGYPGAAARIPDELIGANISRAVGLLRTNGRVSAEFLVCFLNSSDGRRMVLAPSAGSAQQVVNLAALNKLQFPIPSNPEQTAIATVLSDMDTEIESLESKLAKAREIKQGMMQELLTGRIRLV
jgi:type I restriction enzyme S subunit